MEELVPLWCLELFLREMCYQPGNLKEKERKTCLFRVVFVMNEIFPGSPSSSQIADAAIVIPQRKRMENDKLCATKHEEGGARVTELRNVLISYHMLFSTLHLFLSALYGGPAIREQCHRLYARVSS